MELAVADIEEIDWKQAALDDLHIPAKKKAAVQALSEAHVKRASTNAFDDVERKQKSEHLAQLFKEAARLSHP